MDHGRGLETRGPFGEGLARLRCHLPGPSHPPHGVHAPMFGGVPKVPWGLHQVLLLVAILLVVMCENFLCSFLAGNNL